ncbi:MAG: glycosyltransferase family 4 protein, partial [Solirubrobacterales bacterium]
MLTPDFPPGRGGIQQLLGRLAGELTGASLTVVSLAQHRDPGSVVGSNLDRSVDGRVLRLPVPGVIGQRARVVIFNLASLVVALLRRPDVVLVGHIVAVPAARVIARILRRPYVLILHAQELPNRPGLMRSGVHRSAATIAVSSHTRSEAERLGADSRKIVVINPGVDLPATAGEQPVIATKSDDHRPTIVTIARMVDRYKGHDVMTDAVERLRRRGLNPLWIVAGEGPLRSGYQREVAERGLNCCISFTGAVDDAQRERLLTQADVFAMPSRVPAGGGGEGFGLVYLEAAARGLPVVAGNEGGAVDAVRDGETGLLVDPRDARAVADALARLLVDRDLAAEMG